jgi:hypothetical protein
LGLLDLWLLTIEEISGILDHSSACNELQDMDCDPSIGFHPKLRAYALDLLRENIPITQIQQLCKKWAAKRWDASSMGDNIHRHRLNEHDASSLYRTISRERGILQRTAAEDNLNSWFQHDSPTPPDAALRSSMLYYHPCSNDNERLVLIIATPEIQEAAWKFGHKGHVLTDLTFGFTSACANLLILMALNDNHKGVPIGLIIFTAMWLLKDITQYPEAIAAYNAELDYFKALSNKSDAISKAQGKGSLAFLNYLGSYLQVRSFWLLWSKAGVIEAATRLGVPLDKVPRTNNHLESFNGRIKNKYFEAYKHTGWLPWLDLWVLFVITKVMPDYFQQLRDRQSQQQYYIAMRKAPSCVRGTSSIELPDLDHRSLLSPDNSITSVQDTAEEYEMIDGDANSDSEHNHDHEEASKACKFRDFGAQPLQIDSDGEGCSIADAVLGGDSGEETVEGDLMDLGFVGGGDMTWEDSESYEDNSMPWDNAMGSENILNGLRGLTLDSDNISLLPPLPAPLVPIDMNTTSCCIPASPAGTPSLANAQATAMQEMLVVQDKLGRVLRKLKMLNIDNVLLEPYTPTYLCPWVFGDTAAPEPLVVRELPQLEPRCPTSNLSQTCRKMVLDNLDAEVPNLSGSESDEHAPVGENQYHPLTVQRLLPLQHQTKERRKESCGIR